MKYDFHGINPVSFGVGLKLDADKILILGGKNENDFTVNNSYLI